MAVSDREPDVRKKRKVSPTCPELPMSRSMTPMGTASPVLGPIKRDHGRSSLRNEISEGERDKSTWSKERWREAAQMFVPSLSLVTSLMSSRYQKRALLLKRHGDAHQRSPTARPEFTHLPHDPLQGMLCLTDAVLLWLYSYFCNEQAGGRVRSSPYNESAPLREFVRKGWEAEVRRAKEEEAREMARAMVGLM